jgi:hypothetical protein
VVLEFKRIYHMNFAKCSPIARHENSVPSREAVSGVHISKPENVVHCPQCCGKCIEEK